MKSALKSGFFVTESICLKLEILLSLSSDFITSQYVLIFFSLLEFVTKFLSCSIGIGGSVVSLKRLRKVYQGYVTLISRSQKC